MTKESRPLSAAEAELLAPDATLGVIIVVMCCALLAFVVFVPCGEGVPSSDKWFIVAIAVTWLGRGIAKITAARAWKRDNAKTA